MLIYIILRQKMFKISTLGFTWLLLTGLSQTAIYLLISEWTAVSISCSISFALAIIFINDLQKVFFGKEDRFQHNYDEYHLTTIDIYGDLGLLIYLIIASIF